MDLDADLLKFLGQMSQFGTRPKGFIYNNLYDFVLKTGRPHKVPKRRPPIPLWKKGECFMNAFKIVDDYFLERKSLGQLTYVEGYAYTVGIPMLHAWAIDPYDCVFDPTWEEGKAYYGVEFPLDYVRKVILKRKAWGVLDCWEIGWPLLTGEDDYPIRR